MGLLLLPSSVGKILCLVLLHLYGVLFLANLSLLSGAFGIMICPFPTVFNCVVLVGQPRPVLFAPCKLWCVVVEGLRVVPALFVRVSDVTFSALFASLAR
jgi:hypothetical protein